MNLPLGPAVRSNWKVGTKPLVERWLELANVAVVPLIVWLLIPRKSSADLRPHPCPKNQPAFEVLQVRLRKITSSFEFFPLKGVYKGGMIRKNEVGPLSEEP